MRYRTIFFILILFTSSCSSRSISDPTQAKDCTELVEAGKAVAERVLERLDGQTLEELEAANPDEPLAPIDYLMRVEEFENQAAVLGCGKDQLRLQACSVYADLEVKASGDLARDFLAPYLESCS